MFWDEARFGRINEIAKCWAPLGIRPTVPFHVVREYMYLYGAVDPITGDNTFVIAPTCNTAWSSAFLEVLSKRFENDYILLCGDKASWHTTKKLKLPDNIELFDLLACTPEMNPIEQLWPEFRHDFKNKMFSTLDKISDQLCVVVNKLTNDVVKSVTGRDWIYLMF